MRVPFGQTGLETSRVAFGAGSIGGPELSEGDVARLLAEAIELGIVLFDAARSYGAAEERLGRHLRDVRDRVLLSTKLGYGVEGVPDWTGSSVTAGVDRALGTFGVDHLDVVHLHSCPREVLARGDVLEALLRARAAGKLRVAAYSGDGEALEWAVDSGAFGAVQASFSLCDRANRPALERARARGLGVLGKRALANAPWRPAGSSADEPYRDRWAALGLDLGGDEPMSVAIRYAAHHGPLDAILVGTRSAEHLRQALAAMREGPLPPGLVAHVEARWEAVGAGWPAHV